MTDNTDARTKTVENWLIINWDTGSTRTRKSPADDLGTHELQTRLTIDVEIPDVDVPELAARIDVPQPHVQAAVLESLDDEQIPDWGDTAADVLDEHADTIRAADPRTDRWSEVVDLLTARVLMRYDGYVEPTKVQMHMNSRAADLHERHE